MVKFGSARISENNSVNGRRGDQTSREVCEQQAYWHHNGWIGIRAKDPNVANAIAWTMKVACQSDIVGYSQNDRYIIFFTGIQNGVPTNADCSSLVAFCVYQAGIRNFEVEGFYTGNEVERLLRTGAFDKFTVNSLDDLQTGDILVDGNLTSHTIVVTEGQSRDVNVFDAPEPVLQLGDKGAEVRKLQAFFEEYGSGCTVDGDYGRQTKQLVSDFQTIWGLKRDGIYGQQTHDALCFYLYAKGVQTI
jgi:hypothetical protein